MTVGRGDELGILSGLVGYHLRRASSVFMSDFTRALDGTDMRQVPFAILAVIESNPGIQQGEVGRRLGIKRTNMVVLINELVEAGWVERNPSPSDRRALALTLTGKGEKVFADAVRRIREHEAAMLAPLSEAERGSLVAMLQRISAAAEAS
jgi:DNA-binding MarR family transcriptional regulator